MGALVTLKDLRVFRGTYAEIKDRPTEDKMVYLAWDTQELFIGNARGVKVKYGGVKNLENLLSESFEAFRTDIYSTIDEYAYAKVEGTLEETKAALAEKINTDIAALKSEEDSKINTISTDLSTLTSNTSSRFNTMSTKIGEIESAVNTLRTTTSDLTTRLTALEGEATINFSLIGGLDRSVTAIQTSLTEIQESTGALQESVSKLHANTILYGTGSSISDEVASLRAENKLNEFIPTFCTSSYGDYLVGSIYYYNGETIAASGTGGGSSTIEHTATISANFLDFDTRYEIESGSKTGRVSISVSGDDSAIVSYDVALLKNNIAMVGYEHLVNGQSVVLSTDAEAVYSLRITVETTPNTVVHKYTVNTSADSTIEVYTPIITNIRFVSNNTQRDFNYIGTYTNIPIEAEKTLYIYSTQAISHIIFNGGLVDEELDFTSEVSDLSGYQYKYNLGSNWFDTSLPSITLS